MPSLRSRPASLGSRDFEAVVMEWRLSVGVDKVEGCSNCPRFGSRFEPRYWAAGQRSS